MARPGESAHDVVASLASRSEELHALWAALAPDEWGRRIAEPDDGQDLGPLTLAQLSLLRLTEVEVHGGDVGLGLGEWSPLFVEVALPFRLEWLNRRRANHRGVDTTLQGSWLLVALEGPTYLVSVSGASVRSAPASPTSPASATITGTKRDLLALLLGPTTGNELQISGDVRFGRAWQRAFPGP